MFLGTSTAGISEDNSEEMKKERKKLKHEQRKLEKKIAKIKRKINSRRERKMMKVKKALKFIFKKFSNGYQMSLADKRIYIRNSI